jgi:hypothetical protein
MILKKTKKVGKNLLNAGIASYKTNALECTAIGDI